MVCFVLLECWTSASKNYQGKINLTLMVKKHIDVLTYNSNIVISNKDERVSFIDSSTKLREYYECS